MALSGRTLIIAFMTITFSSYIIQQSGILTESRSMPLSPTDYDDLFSIAIFDVATISTALTVGGLIGIAGILFKQYVFASIALLIWLIGVFWKPSNAFLTAFPKLVEAVVPAEASYLSIIPSAFIGVAFFFWLAGILAQRDLQ